ncbi:conserved hypothetical protein; putative exported protein [Herminiimonas arsenicoxydans]|uniref:Formate dehydrogenase n=1 Tax=Herminiimonas arsenicoxydans TaxID=204773 RepID=A4G4Z6_HERAR|nr:conserved hypothetical protein; putative exported protein [Herminiimonas arsenicoxydans]
MAEKTKIPRRSFFAGLGLVAAAGVAAKLAPESASSVLTNVISPQEPEGKSYRLTEHVKKYYRTTTI